MQYNPHDKLRVSRRISQSTHPLWFAGACSFCRFAYCRRCTLKNPPTRSAQTKTDKTIENAVKAIDSCKIDFHYKQYKQSQLSKTRRRVIFIIVYFAQKYCRMPKYANNFLWGCLWKRALLSFSLCLTSPCPSASTARFSTAASPCAILPPRFYCRMQSFI